MADRSKARKVVHAAAKPVRARKVDHRDGSELVIIQA